MKQFLTFGCTIALAFVMMDSSQAVKSPLGFSVVKGEAPSRPILAQPRPRQWRRPWAKGRHRLWAREKRRLWTRG